MNSGDIPTFIDSWHIDPNHYGKGGIYPPTFWLVRLNIHSCRMHDRTKLVILWICLTFMNRSLVKPNNSPILSQILQRPFEDFGAAGFDFQSWPWYALLKVVTEPDNFINPELIINHQLSVLSTVSIHDAWTFKSSSKRIAWSLHITSHRKGWTPRAEKERTHLFPRRQFFDLVMRQVQSLQLCQSTKKGHLKLGLNHQNHGDLEDWTIRK